MKEYRDLFLAESAKNLSRIEAILEGRGEEPPGGVVEALFREFHSYKGMAGTMRFDAMAKLAHRIEDTLDSLRGSAETPGEAARALLYRCLDRLSAMREDVVAGGAGEIEWADLFPPGGAGDERSSRSAPASVAVPARALKVAVAIDPDCPTPAARAFLIVSRFRESFPNLSSIPPLDELMAGARTGSVKLTLPDASRAEVADVYDTLTEVAGLVFDEDDRRPPPAAQPSAAAESRAMLPETVEVDSATLDGLVDLVGELTLAMGRVREVSGAVESEPLREEARKLESMVRALDERVMAMRCLPFSTVGGRLRRFVREEAEKLGKKARLSIVGGQTGVDKGVMLSLSGPLTHLLRNALDHGIESPGTRVAAGKHEEGAITVELERSKNLLRLSITDDGSGIDSQAVMEAAVRKGLVEADERGEPAQAYRYLFMPGFSTRQAVGELSGRGVGLDAVASEIAALGGEIRVDSTPGEGTRFYLDLPVSPAISPALTLEAGGFALALPVFSVSSTFECAERDLVDEGGGLWVERGGERLPVRFLSDLTGSGGRPDERRLAMVVVERGGCRTCLAADRLVREEYIYVKPFRGMWEGLAGVSGYSVTGDGRIVYLLDPSWLCGE